jgi:hypothetical protein
MLCGNGRTRFSFCQRLSGVAACHPLMFAPARAAPFCMRNDKVNED